MREHFADISLGNVSGKITYLDDDNGLQPMLFIHGLGLNKIFWTKLIPELRHKYRCIAIDLPGHGNSVDFRGDFSIPFYSNGISAFITKMQLNNVILVGHSMGGQIAMNIAASNPEWLQKLVLICPAGIEKFNALESHALKLWADRTYNAHLTANKILKAFQVHFESDHSLLKEIAAEQLHQEALNKTLMNQMTAASIYGMLDHPVSDKINNIHCDSLVIFARNDKAIPNKFIHPNLDIMQIARDAKHSFQKSVVKIIESGGHYLPVEKQQLLAELIGKFLHEQ
ncbi:MAG: alpha/beta hydrolase [Bacteroidia bacterium]